MQGNDSSTPASEITGCPHCGSDIVLGRASDGMLIFRCGSSTADPNEQTETCETAQKAVWKVTDEVAALRAERDGLREWVTHWFNEAERMRPVVEAACGHVDHWRKVAGAEVYPIGTLTAAVDAYREAADGE
jgi:hypothetical protein